MEFKGRIMKVLPMRSGVSMRTGNEWKSQPFIFEYFEHETDRYSDKVQLESFREGDMALIKEGAEVICGFGHSVREYEGRYYNEVRMYSIRAAGAAAGAEKDMPSGEPSGTVAQNAPAAAGAGKDMPSGEPSGTVAQKAPAADGAENNGDDLPF